MHTYVKSRNEPLWTVGYYVGDDWQALVDCDTQLDAICLVNILNGGDRELNGRLLQQLRS